MYMRAFNHDDESYGSIHDVARPFQLDLMQMPSFSLAHIQRSKAEQNNIIIYFNMKNVYYWKKSPLGTVQILHEFGRRKR